jgi:hypothetical protein
MNTHPSIFIQQITTNSARNSFQEETVSSPSYSFAVDDLIAEKGMKHLLARLYQRKIKQS